MVKGSTSTVTLTMNVTSLRIKMALYGWNTLKCQLEKWWSGWFLKSREKEKRFNILLFLKMAVFTQAYICLESADKNKFAKYAYTQNLLKTLNPMRKIGPMI